MKQIISGVLLLATAASSAAAQRMEVSASSTRSPVKGAATFFTGAVLVTPMYGPNDSTSVGGLVAFEAGARSAWHTHPAGQVLIISDGTGWVQEEGQPKRQVKMGDVIWTPPGVKHWHGATATDAMSHIAITNMKDGKNVDWMEKVSDEQYGK